MNESPAIILIHPQMGENIGAAARAMANFGLTDLRLVAPRDGWPNAAAKATSSGAFGLVHTQVFADTHSAIADLHAVLATTARPRDMVKPVLTPHEAAEHIQKKSEAGIKSGILFGPERTGLENDDIVRAQAIVTIPANPQFCSFNLAQSVLLLSYEIFNARKSSPQRGEVSWGGEELSTLSERENFLNRLESALEEVGFFKTAAQKPTMQRNIRNIFTRGDLTAQEIRTLHGIINALKLRDYRE